MKLKVKKSTNTVQFLETVKDFKELGLRKSFKIEGIGFKKCIRKSADGTKRRILTGYAATIDKDRTDDIITIEALQKSKDDLLQPGSSTVFYNHDRSKPIGKTIATRLDSKGLIVDILISKAKDVEDVWLKIKEGVLNSLSIGGRFKKVQIERDAQERIVAFKILELELFENSVVGIPMNPKASIFSVVEKSFKGLIERPLKKGKKMKTKAVEKEETKVEAPAAPVAMTEATVKSMIKEAVDASQSVVMKGIETLTASVTALGAPKKEEAKEAPKVEGEVVPAWAKSLTDTVSALSAKVEASGTRKGVVEEEEEQDEEQTEPSNKIVKSFSNDLGDADACKYAAHVMKNESKFKKLTDDQKSMVRGLYLKMMEKNNRKK